MEPATGYPIPPNQQRPNPNGYPHPPPGTAYPYQAPPQPSNPYYYNPAAYTVPGPTTLCRRLLLGFIVVTAIFFTILFISWIVIRPRVPSFHLTSFSLSSFNSSGHQLSGAWAARFEVFNPNKKMDIEYDEIQAFVFFRRQSLTQNRLQPFLQQRKNLTVMETQFSIINTFVDQWVSDAVDAEKKRGSLTFDLKVVADVGFRVGELRSRRRLLRVDCYDLTVTLPGSHGSGNLTKAPRRCDVYA
ncbi:NDR1/HIN1-like protein 10 [Linum perenne]